MTAVILDGKRLSEEIKEKVKEKIKEKKLKLGLAVILVGKNPASIIYTNVKKEACEYVGIKSYKYNLERNTTEKELLGLINKLNNDKNITGILVQLPLPLDINKEKIFQTIKPIKDVDGFNPKNIGLLAIDKERFSPCTPKGILRLLEHYKINVEGKNVVIINHSNVVGKPLALMMLNKDATATVCHIKTKNLIEYTKKADILITAVGKPNLITKQMVKEKAVVVDAGICKIRNKTIGDVDFENVKKIVSYITPVPGGVGPMTIAMLLENTLLASKLQKDL
jgi:methylenetetrahydrofolate dehydrogenase (NADP+)/methenyltetrahydrofolate cyclohydrolase